MIIKKIVLFAFMSCLIVTAKSQKIDSLKALLNGKTQADQADILYTIAYEYIDVDNEAAGEYGLQGYYIAQQLKDSIRIAKTGRILAASLLRRGSVDSALKLYNIVLPIVRKKEIIYDLRRVLNSLGNSYSMKANYDVALKLHFESLILQEQARDTAAIANALHNIGFVYYKLKDYDKALVYWQRCLTLKDKINYNSDRDLLLINIASAYTYKNDLIRAKKFVNSGLRNCQPVTLTVANFISGVIHYKNNVVDSAEMSFLRSYRDAKQQKDTRLQFDNIDYLSQIYLQQERIDKALYYLNEGEKLIRNGNPYKLEAIKIYGQFFRAYNKTKEYRKVCTFQKKYIDLRDSVYNEELTLNLMRTEAEFHERENLARISSQNQILELKEKVIQRQEQLKVFIGVVVLGLILLAGVLIWNNRQKQTIRNALDIKVRERTDTLEQSYRSLMLLKKEREALLRHTSVDINGSLSTITGLCTLALKDISDPQSLEYISELNKVSNDLVFCSKKFQTLNSQDKKSF